LQRADVAYLRDQFVEMKNMGLIETFVDKSATQSERRVLVFGDDTRSFLTTVRSLARQGIEVHVAPFDFTSPALKSRYIAEIHWLPYYLGDGAEWLSRLKGILDQRDFRLIIPCDERALLPLHRHREELAPLCRLALPDDNALDVFYDKQKTRETARSLEIPVAQGRLIAPTDTVQSILAEARLPLVIKPRRSYDPTDLYARGRVAIVENEAALADILPSTRDGSYFFEAFFPGQGGGLSVLAHQGRVLQAFEHRRVHERGGSGYYRVSAPLSPPLLDAVERIVAALDYTGVAMFEFKIDLETSNWILLEVNARPWGSMPLPVGLGVDFPYDWYRLLVDGVETPTHSYKVGIHARNLVPDLRASFADARDRGLQLWRLAPFFLRTAWEYHRVLTGREFHDVLVWDDPRPGLSEFNELLQGVKRRLLGRLPGAERRMRHRDRQSVRSAVRAAGSGPFTVMFVCQGNICRSPFAERLLRQRIEARAERAGTGGPGVLSRVVAQSAGMLPRSGRASPAAAIEAAKRFGLDLSAHRSGHLGRDLAEAASLLVVFDGKNLQWLRQRFVELPGPVIYLGSLVDIEQDGVEIDDPDGRDLSTFNRVYAQIERAIDRLVSLMGEAEGK